MQALRDWGDRINHLHVKDVRLEVLRKVIEDRAGMEAVWRWGTFCELGTGDVDVEGFLALVKDGGFSGWLVVEQDRIPGPDERMDDATESQALNRRFLEARGI